MHQASIYKLYLITFLFHSFIYAQNVENSLLQKDYSELLSTFLQYEESNQPKAKKAISAYLRKAKANHDTIKIAEAYYHLYNVTDTKSKLHYTDSIIYITKSIQNDDFPARAYFRKAQFFLFERRNIKKTLSNLNHALVLAKKNNNTKLLYRIEYYFGIVRSEHLGEKEKAIRIFKKCEEFYRNKKEYNYTSRYLYTLHALADTYIGLKKYDSTSYYNSLGYKTASQSSDITQSQLKTYFTLCEGVNQFEQQNYVATIDSIHRALPKILEINDKSNIIDSYFYLGKSHYARGDQKKAVFYFQKTDSILETLKSIPQYKHVKTYEYLKDHYKETGDLENQNKYLDKLNSVLSNYLNDQIFISKKIKEDYDIPLLLEEKEALIKKLNDDNNTYELGLITLGGLLIMSGGLLFYQYQKKLKYRSRFEALIKDLNSTEDKISAKEDKPAIKNKDLKVPEKHVTYILDKLNEFEKEHKYLETGISSQSLADSMETNVKYLSRVINYYKDKTFTSYLNELRINFAVKELQENIKLRKFTIKAIANEFGYSTAETFSNAFYKQVKIKPSYFIKELGKENS
ncbi:helix-turn-helix domain-containing protein [Aquimarina sp. D1M17]|uniref:helix-turn-helix domain-containing protein n=1 Tax=Aquimarina acroporae TaxID=2937283 RepID=UPI0020C10C36|nr:helix-turn-helix domain-containing protein [Aquimarina acroporae]MCK8524381.1 helix-turn-helix domain-containing protein [Aquimarina acroporae]